MTRRNGGLLCTMVVMTSKKGSDKTSRWHVRTILALALVFAWLGFAGIGGPYFGKIEEVSSNDFATFLPKSAESTKVNNELKKFRDSGSIPVIAVFESNKALTDAQQSEITKARDAVEASGVATGGVSPVVVADDTKAAYFLVPIDSDSEFGEVTDHVRKEIDVTSPSVDYTFTGPAMFSKELEKAFAGIDGTLLVVALSVVFVILLVVYRSPILPIATLMSAIVALAAAIFVVWHLADAGIILLNGQVQGILFILVIGAATDYALLYIARYREELTEHESPWLATKAAWKASVEPVLAAGGTVTLGLLCLLASDLGSNKALGPVGGFGIAFSVLTALTFLPAVLLLFGRAAFWPRRPQYVATKKHVGYRKHHPAWSKIGDLVSKHPRRLWVGIMTLLIVACFAIPQFRAEGVSQENLVLGESEAKQGQAVIDRHFAAGSGSPAYVIVPKDGWEDVVTLIEKDDGVDGVSIMTTDADKASMPVGKSAQELSKTIFEKVEEARSEQLAQLRQKLSTQMAGAPAGALEAAYQAAAQQVPSAVELYEKANPFHGLTIKEHDDRFVLMVTLTDAASSVEARNTIDRLRQSVEAEHPEVMFGGVSAIQLDTNTASRHDLMVVIPLILVAVTIVLMLLLRSIMAPIILLLTTLLSFGATIGISALLFNNVWGFPGADPVVIIFGFVFLVALGIDYNIFLMTRVREETGKLGVRAGTLKALIVTGGVITSAGIVLAATFAALNVIPILFLAQISFIVAFGVMLDTLIVRSLLVPALTLEIGRLTWWPSKLWRNGKK